MFEYELFPDTLVAYHLNDVNRHLADFIDASRSAKLHGEWVYIADAVEARAFEDEFTAYIYGSISWVDE